MCCSPDKKSCRCCISFFFFKLGSFYSPCFFIRAFANSYRCICTCRVSIFHLVLISGPPKLKLRNLIGIMRCKGGFLYQHSSWSVSFKTSHGHQKICMRFATDIMLALCPAAGKKVLLQNCMGSWTNYSANSLPCIVLFAVVHIVRGALAQRFTYLFNQINGEQAWATT